MDRSLLLICTSSIIISHCNGALHKQIEPVSLPFVVKNYLTLSTSPSSTPSASNQPTRIIGGRRGYYKDRQKLLELDYGVQLSSVENRKPYYKKQDSDDVYRVSRLKLGKKIPPVEVAAAGTPAGVDEIEKLAGIENEATSPATIKSTRCTTDKRITVGSDFQPSSKEIVPMEPINLEEVDTGKGSDASGGDGKGGDASSGDEKGGDANSGDENGGDANSGDEKGGDVSSGDEKGGDANVVHTTEDSGPKDADKVSQNYARPPGPNVLPDYYVDDQ